MVATLVGFIKQEFGRNIFTKMAAVAALPVLKSLKKRIDPRRYNGAALLGLRGLVFKSHGSADAFAFEGALNRAYDAARNHLLERVHDQISDTLQAMPSAPHANERAAPGAALAA
jgi:glycerol-3-phosphate acyltransferase PlsX